MMSILLCVVMIVGNLVACGSSDNANNKNDVSLSSNNKAFEIGTKSRADRLHSGGVSDH